MLYDNISRLCNERGITIAELERDSGIANGTIGKWRDSTNDPRFSNVKAVADYFGTTVDDLINPACGGALCKTRFYKRYCALCSAAGMSTSGVAVAIGLSNAAAHGWKMGKTPSDTTLVKLANYFGVTVEYLVGAPEGKPLSDETPEPKPDSKFTMQERIDEAADSLAKIIRHYSESSEYLAPHAEVVVQAATALAELAKVATK